VSEASLTLWVSMLHLKNKKELAFASPFSRENAEARGNCPALPLLGKRVLTRPAYCRSGGKSRVKSTILLSPARTGILRLRFISLPFSVHFALRSEERCVVRV